MDLRTAVLMAFVACAQTRAPLPTAETIAAEDPIELPAAFAGTLPCADCPGLETRLTLLDPGRYVLEETYLERGSFVSRGTWQQTAGVLRLVPRGGGERLFQRMGPSRLVPLDAQGRPIEAGADLGLERIDPPQLHYGRLQPVDERVRLVECEGSRLLPIDDATPDRQIREAIRPFETEAFGDLLGYVNADGTALVVLEAERIAADAEGCLHLPAADVRAEARAADWGMTVDARQVRLTLPAGEAAAWPTAPFRWRDGAWRFASASEVAIGEIELRPGRCADPSATASYAWTATLVLDGARHVGCASLGPAWTELGR